MRCTHWTGAAIWYYLDIESGTGPQEQETKMKQSKPYGTRDNGTAYCVNSNPGSFGHECSKPAKWIGRNPTTGFEACYCDGCKASGYEAKGQQFRPFAQNA